MPRLKTVPTSPAAREFNDAVKGVLAQFKDQLDALEMLAVTAHLVGVIIALQDQRKVTNEMAMQLVASNIEVGNAEAIQSLLSSQGEA